MNKDKRDFLFRHVPLDIRYKILIDEEAIYSTTDQVTANKISREIIRFVNKESIITDATACIGGSSYSFSKYFDNINAIEIDENRFNYLQNNIKLLECENVNCIHGDALEECLKLNQDVIFIDPPWGGPEYKKKNIVDLYLSDLPFSEVCKKLSQVCKYIIIKVPINFNETDFINNTKKELKLIYKNISLRKMHLLIFTTIDHQT
jgi:predicted RNA methylase